MILSLLIQEKAVTKSIWRYYSVQMTHWNTGQFFGGTKTQFMVDWARKYFLKSDMLKVPYKNYSSDVKVKNEERTWWKLG